jgi:lysophospholipid acyltransferase (LPLAT)-like uncharacterized protein
VKFDRAIRWFTPLIAWIALRFVNLLARTWSWEMVGDKHLPSASGPVVYAFWHGCLYPCGHYLARTLGECGLPAAAFISLSRDGEITARMATGRGLRVVRGSTSKAGLEGLRRLHRAMVREGVSVLTAPDGPRGPAGSAQPGAVILAQTAGAPLVPLACAASSAWRLGSWDRLLIPKPFARVAVVVGEPARVERGCDLDAETAALGERLDEVLETARERIGGSAAQRSAQPAETKPPNPRTR